MKARADTSALDTDDRCARPSDDGRAAGPREEDEGDAFADASRHLDDLSRSVRDYVRVKVDRARLKVHEVSWALLPALAGALVGLVLAAVAAAFVLQGIAGLLASAFGGNVPLAQLVTGFLVLGLVFGLGLAVRGVFKRRFLREMTESYEDQLERQAPPCPHCGAH